MDVETPQGPSVHTLRVSLRRVEPEVWRRVVVRSDTPLSELAQTLERAMGWEGYHLHLFEVAGVVFAVPGDDEDEVIDETHATVRHALPKVGSRLRWDYDFGDGWEHDVVVEALSAPEPDVRYPICVDGARGCPPEDTGGPQGYAAVLRVLAEPEDDGHRHLVEAMPAGFHPALFDLDAANRRLHGG